MEPVNRFHNTQEDYNMAKPKKLPSGSYRIRVYLGTDSEGKQIVKSITDIASAYGAGVCVEGIENEIMRDKVRKYQVKSIQGFFYSKPVIFDEFKSFCKKERSLL